MTEQEILCLLDRVEELKEEVETLRCYSELNGGDGPQQQPCVLLFAPSSSGLQKERENEMNTFEVQKKNEEKILKSAGKCKFCGTPLTVTPNKMLFTTVMFKYGEAKVKIGCFRCGIYLEVKSWDTQKNTYADACNTAIQKWHSLFDKEEKHENDQQKDLA